MNNPVTRFNGTLKKWNDERGFGFLVADHGEQELFVHVSAFPSAGRAPRVGEVVSFEVDVDRDGRKRAVKVRRPGESVPNQVRRSPPARSHSARRSSPSRANASFLGAVLVALLVVAGLGWYGYGRYTERVEAAALATQAQNLKPPEPPPVAKPKPKPKPKPRAEPPRAVNPRAEQPSPYLCDGRQYCSEMTSCEEAKFFIRNCPDTKMDGDSDGLPCEGQWCSAPFSD